MEWTTAYLPLTADLAAAGLDTTVAAPAAAPTPDLAQAAPDLVSTGVAVLAHRGEVAPGDPLEVVAGRRMAHHLASAADVEIPVRLLVAQADGPLPQDEADAILSRTMLAVLVAVS